MGILLTCRAVALPAEPNPRAKIGAKADALDRAPTRFASDFSGSGKSSSSASTNILFPDQINLILSGNSYFEGNS